MQASKLSFQRIVWYLAFALLFSFVIPIFFSWFGVDEITMMEIILFGINVVYVIAMGIYAGKRAEKLWLLALFPVCYAIGCDFFFDSHAIYFAVVYLMLAGFSYGMVRD